MKVLITGGNGFIGKHVVKELLSRGVEVVAYDVVPPRESQKGVTYVEGTILDTYSLTKALTGCDAVFHLAAILGVKRADHELLKCMTINIQGTINVLEACMMARVNHIVFSSSSEVFGDVTNEALNEESPFNPKSGYAISKLSAEQYIQGFHKEYGLNYNIVRFFSVYGPGQVAEFVVPRFIKMVQKGMAPQIYGNGEQTRAFCHIADASRGLVDVFMSKEARNQIFNIGNDQEAVSMKALADRVVKILGSNVKPQLVPFSQSDRNSAREIYFRAPDISKLRKVIGYEPRVSLDEGIRNVAESGDIPESWIDPLTAKSALTD